MDLSLGLIFVVVFLLSYYIMKRPKNLPPGPFRFPIFGSLSFARKMVNRRPHLVLMEAAQKYGDVMSFSIGPRLVVALTGFDIVHEALVKQADVFSGRPANFKILDQAFKDGGNRGVIFNNYGQAWRTMRRFTLQALRDFGVGKTSLEDKIFTEIDAVSKRLEKLEGRPVSLNSYLQNLITNVIYGIVFGKRYEYEDPEFERVGKLTNVALMGPGPLGTANFLPLFIVRLIDKAEVDRFDGQLNSFRKMQEYILGQIDEHEETFDDNNIRDFIDIYIRTVREASEENTKVLDKQDMFRVIMDLFLAGSETTSTSLDWAFLYITEYPEVQKKCQQEITEVFGDKPVVYADRGKLVYVEATLLEIQRHSTIVPLNVSHSTLKDTTLAGYTIPKGTIVIPSIYSVSYDSNYWKEPFKFQPERFIDDSGKLIKHTAMIPFSTGPRQCLGEPLARMELFLIFTNLLQRFDFEPEDKSVKHSLDPKQHQITNCPLPYNSRVYKRVETF